MFKVALIDVDHSYHPGYAGESETPCQVLMRFNINPETRKVFIDGARLTEEKCKTPLSVLHPYGKTVFLTIKF